MKAALFLAGFLLVLLAVQSTCSPRKRSARGFSLPKIDKFKDLLNKPKDTIVKTIEEAKNTTKNLVQQGADSFDNLDDKLDSLVTPDFIKETLASLPKIDELPFDLKPPSVNFTGVEFDRELTITQLIPFLEKIEFEFSASLSILQVKLKLSVGKTVVYWALVGTGQRICADEDTLFTIASFVPSLKPFVPALRLVKQRLGRLPVQVFSLCTIPHFQLSIPNKTFSGKFDLEFALFCFPKKVGIPCQYRLNKHPLFEFSFNFTKPATPENLQFGAAA